MTLPTLQEFAGIFMLALLTAGLIAHPSAETQAAAASTETVYKMDTSYIDGIATIALPAPRDAGSARVFASGTALR
jgi:hypothetical protein